MTLRAIGNEIGISDSPQNIKHHLLQLQKRGFLSAQRQKVNRDDNKSGLISLPIISWETLERLAINKKI